MIKNLIFIVNPLSGNQLGKNILDLNIKNLKEKILKLINSEFNLSIYFLNVLFSNYIEKLKNIISKNSYDNYIIICGGDGTFTCMISKFIENNINISSWIFGIFPIGTGNDMGFFLNIDPELFLDSKKNLIKNCENNLIKYIIKLLANNCIEIDFWEYEIEIYENGDIYKIMNKLPKSLKLFDNILKEKNIYKGNFINYNSFGIESKLGFCKLKRFWKI